MMVLGVRKSVIPALVSANNESKLTKFLQIFQMTLNGRFLRMLSYFSIHFWPIVRRPERLPNKLVKTSHRSVFLNKERKVSK